MVLAGISAVHRSRSAGAGVLAYLPEPEFVQLRQNSGSTYFLDFVLQTTVGHR
jgi:hypothetical protein